MDASNIDYVTELSNYIGIKEIYTGANVFDGNLSTCWKDRTLIGHNVVLANILPGITIGDGAIIGVCAVVSKDVEETFIFINAFIIYFVKK